MNEKILLNKTAIVTGAGSGLGRATALLMAQEGARLAVIDINKDGLDKTASEIKDINGTVLSYCIDIRNGTEIHKAVDEVCDTFGSLDILANIAGIWDRHTGKRTYFIDSEEETWKQIIGVNLFGTMICSRAALGQMIKQRSGKIINLGSVSGVSGLPMMADYSASKGAVIAFTKALAIEVGEHNIQVNCVSPGSVDTVGNGKAPPTLLGRAGTAEENAQLILFLASHNADFITGQNYIIDGGRTLSTRW